MAPDLLEELERLPPAQRGRRLETLGVREALRQLPPAVVLDWLERCIDGPIADGWGRAARLVGAEWDRLQKWLRLSKPHCLMAFDAIATYALDEELPPGVPGPQELHQALSAAQQAMGNPRTERILKDAKKVWPARKATRTKPAPAAVSIGEAILAGQKKLQSQLWASLPGQQADGLEVLEAILHFAERRNFACIVDWREDPDEAIAMVLGLEPIAADAGRSVDRIEADELSEVLAAMGRLLRAGGWALAQFDVGSDAYPLAVVKDDLAAGLAAAVSALTGGSGSAQVLG